jgi:protein-S-isoprenylcysteine O-methyltransferase Ste14
VLFLCGAGLLLYGAGLALRSTLLLHGRGRPRRGKRPAFVIAGPYRRMRNPGYAGVVLLVLGGAIMSRRAGGLLLALLVAAACHLWVTLREEPRLRTQFGNAYAVYLERVPRWWPRFRASRRG